MGGPLFNWLLHCATLLISSSSTSGSRLTAPFSVPYERIRPSKGSVIGLFVQKALLLDPSLQKVLHYGRRHFRSHLIDFCPKGCALIFDVKNSKKARSFDAVRFSGFCWQFVYACDCVPLQFSLFLVVARFHVARWCRASYIYYSVVSQSSLHVVCDGV